MLLNKLISIDILPVKLSGCSNMDEFTSVAIAILISTIAACVRGALKRTKELYPGLFAIGPLLIAKLSLGRSVMPSSERPRQDLQRAKIRFLTTFFDPLG
jgi:hypothetical protein